MSEAPVSHRRTWRLAALLPLLLVRTQHRRLAVRQPSYLPVRRPLGFALPPHEALAFLAVTHGCAGPQAQSKQLLRMQHRLLPDLTQYNSEDVFCT